eukprot:jgi/Undpi1/10940/HiC_scaffold_3.g01466.m1
MAEALEMAGALEKAEALEMASRRRTPSRRLSKMAEASFCIGFMTAMYEVETMCRAEVWIKANLVPLVHKQRAREAPEADMKLSSHAFQMTEMCDLFGGRRLQVALTVLRFAALVLMVGSIAMSLSTGGEPFGPGVDGSCNVNWVHYQPVGNGPAATLLATLGRFLAYFVVLFPAMDVTSVYPLNVMVVANNLMAAVYNDHVDNAENDSVIVTTFRIGCAVPPLLWALLFKDFAAIVGYAGCLTVLIAFVFPAYLNLISQRMCNERFGVSKTPFTGAITSSTPALMACMAFGGVLFFSLLVNDVASILSYFRQ